MISSPPERQWLIDDVLEMPDHALIAVAEDYGYGGDNALDAAKVLKQWGYKVKLLGTN